MKYKPEKNKCVYIKPLYEDTQTKVYIWFDAQNINSDNEMNSIR